MRGIGTQGRADGAGQGGAFLSKQPEVGAERDQPVAAVDFASLSWQHRKYTDANTNTTNTNTKTPGNWHLADELGSTS